MKRICIIASLAFVSLCVMANPLAQKSYTKKKAGTEQSPRVSRPLHSAPTSRLKSGAELTHRLDSIEYVDYTMWNLHYNSLNQLDSELCKELDEETGKYFDRDKATYTYNAKGDWTEKIGYILNAGNWIPDYRYVWQYDENGLMTNEKYSDWDADAKVWENNTRATYTYNASKLLVEEIEEYKNDAGWYIHDKRVYTYNAAGQLHREYIYQGSDALTDSLVFDYSVANKVNVVQYADFMSSDDNLVKSDSTIYTFDTNGNELAQKHYKFKNSSMTFELDNEFTTTYDLSVSMQQTIKPPLFYFEYAYYDSIVNMPMKEVYGEMDSESGEWVEYDDVVYHYSKLQTTSENLVNDQSLILYPNPASQYIKLNTAGTLEICIAGRSVFAGSVASGESINVSAWPQGMYLYQIRTAEGTASGTFVKE